MPQAIPDDSSDALSLRLGAAAIDYYPREAKTFWATHFLRLREPVSVWEETRDVAVIDRSAVACRRGLALPRERTRGERRILELRGELAPGTRLSEDSTPFALYDLPAPYPFEAHPRWIHSYRSARVIEVLDDGALVEETAVDGVTWSELPIALTPAAPPRALNQQVAIDAWADAVIAGGTRSARGSCDRHPEPAPASHSRSRGGLPPSAGDDVDAIVQAVTDLDRSYLAVQGPPGTGKTYVGSHVIARLVRDRGYKVGVVAQSHAVIENMLDRVVAAGVPREQVAKAPKVPTPPPLAAGASSGASGRVGPPAAAGLSFTADHQERDGGVHRRADSRVSSSAARRGTSATRAASRVAAWTSSSSMKPVSSRWHPRSPCRWHRRGCFCSAIRSSCRR